MVTYFSRRLRAPVILNAIICILLVMGSGCRLPCLRYADATPILPEDYNGVTSGDTSAHVGIAEFFNDPVLTQLLTYGLTQNQELMIRNEEVQIASNEILSRRGAYLPFVTIGGGGGFDRNSRFMPLGAAEDQLLPPQGTFPNPLSHLGFGPRLFWQVDIWRQLRNARDAAIQRYNEAVEARDFLITKLVAETAENYYELAALDQRLVYLNQTIEIQNQSLEVAEAQLAAARGTKLGVTRFLAEVRKNESQRYLIKQRIIEVENKINFLVGRYPQHVDREQWDFINLDSRVLQVGIPAQLLVHRRDILAAEREVIASGLDVKVARANFYPRLDIVAGVGFEAFNPRFLFDPGAFVANAAGELVAPLINKKAIQAEYLSANARQLQAIYNYQRTILNAFIEVVNRVNKAENYRESVAIKLNQVKALEESVDVATGLFQGARPEVEYMDVLFAQRDLLEARIVMIETKQQQLSAIVNAYQALGGGYLWSDSGMEFPEYPILLNEVPQEEVNTDPTPANANATPAPAPPAGDEATAPATDEPATNEPAKAE